MLTIFNFVPKFPQNEAFNPKFCIFGQNLFYNTTIFSPFFSTRKNVECTLAFISFPVIPPCHDATTGVEKCLSLLFFLLFRLNGLSLKFSCSCDIKFNTAYWLAVDMVYSPFLMIAEICR